MEAPQETTRGMLARSSRGQDRLERDAGSGNKAVRSCCTGKKLLW